MNSLSLKEVALALAEAGFNITRLAAGTKNARDKGWPDLATRDAATIKRLWDEEPDDNVGIVMGRFRDRNLFVVDIDAKKGKDGFKVLRELEERHSPLPPTYSVNTPSGGKHLYYLSAEPVRQGVNILGPGLDTRAGHGYVVSECSRTAEGEYTAATNDLDIVDAPKWLVQLLAKRAEAPKVQASGIVSASGEARAIAFLKNAAPVEEGGRNDAGYKVACQLKELGCPRTQCFDLMSEHWKCEPMLDPAELQHVVNSAFNYSINSQGSGSPEAQFKPVPAEASAAPWPVFSRKKDGTIEPTLANTVAALQRPDLCGCDLAFDTFQDDVMASPSGKGEWRKITDVFQVALRHRLEKDLGFGPIDQRNLRDSLQLAADNLKFDGAQKWLGSLGWDGVERIGNFVNGYLGGPDTPYARAIGQYLWSALAGRILNPGTKADMVPVLVGDQGWRKSAAVAALAPSAEHFREVSLDNSDNDLARQVRGKLVCELAELSGLSRAESEWLKSWITRQNEEWVQKFQERLHRYPRRCVFVGTSNRDDFLIDETGNRRWLPFRLERPCDVDAIVRDRDQLWAEGAALFSKQGVAYRGAEKLAVMEHEGFTYRDAWEDSIARWLETAPSDHQGKTTGPAPGTLESLTTGEVLNRALGVETRQIHRAQEMRVATILRRLGYQRTRRQTEGGRLYVWSR